MEIEYEDERFVGYLNFDEDERYLEFLVDTVKNQIELLEFYSAKTFNCKLSNGKVISCFNCKLINVENDNLVRYIIDVYVDNDIRRYDELKFNNATAIFPKVNAWFVGRDFSYKSSLDYKGQYLDLTISEGENQKRDLNTEVSETYLKVQLKSESLMDLEFINDIYYKMSVIFSFLMDKYVSYTHYLVCYEGQHSYEIYQRHQNVKNEVELNKVNYRINRTLNDTEFYNIFVAPLTLSNFDIWLNYVGILKSEQLLEEQYLTYARCLEIFARENVDMDIYGEKERKEKSKIYKQLINDMDLDENYKTNLIEAFKHSNRKGFKAQLLQVIRKFAIEERLEMLTVEVNLDKLVGNIVNMRNNLTHGTAFEKIDIQSLVFYKELIKQMVIYFMLQENGLNVSLRINHLCNRFKELPEPLIK